MKLISHRANLNGANPTLENTPNQILKVIQKFDVEIDVWFLNENFFLGHDSPQYLVSKDFFNEKMWIHCKNLLAVEQMTKTNLNWFWHENDKLTITSKGYLWCFPNIYLNNAITVESQFNTDIPKNILGICTDFPERYTF